MGTCCLVTGEGPYPALLPLLKPAPGEPRTSWGGKVAPKMCASEMLCGCWLVGFFFCVVCFVLNHRELLGLQRVPSISTPHSVYIKHPTESHREREISDDRR